MSLIITRDPRIGQGYIAREGTSLTRVWGTCKTTRTAFSPTARVSLPATPGQLLFSNDALVFGSGDNGPSLTDGALWLGAWAFSASPSPNIVTAGAFGPFSASTGSAISGGVGRITGGGQDLRAAFASVVPTATSLSFAVSAKLPSGGGAMQIYLAPDSSSWPRAYVNAAGFFGFTASSVAGYTDPKFSDGLFHHYAWTYAFDIGQLRVYRDGVLSQTLACSVFAAQPLSSFSIVSNTGTETDEFDNLVVYKGVFTPEAITALAGGAMPNALGQLF